MKRFLLALSVCVAGVWAAGSAQAQQFGPSYGSGGYNNYNRGYNGGGFGGYQNPSVAPGGYGGYGQGGNGGYGQSGFGARPHVEYTPPQYDRHRGHADFVPGHYDLHSGGSRYRILPSGGVSPWGHRH